MTGDEGSAQKVNPLIPVDLVVDHSVQVDAFARPDALTINSRKEFERNQERYEFLKWGQSAFANFRGSRRRRHRPSGESGVPGQGGLGRRAVALPGQPGRHRQPHDDDHSVPASWVGELVASRPKAAMVGQPIYMLLPEVVGFRLTGRLSEGTTATDLVPRVTEMLASTVSSTSSSSHGPGRPTCRSPTGDHRQHGTGVRATIGFFPVDDRTLEYLRLTGRDDKLIDTVEQYCKTQGMWRDDNRRSPTRRRSSWTCRRSSLHWRARDDLRIASPCRRWRRSGDRI